MNVFLFHLFLLFSFSCSAQLLHDLNCIRPEINPIEFQSIYLSVENELNAVDKIPGTYRLCDSLGHCAIELHGNSTLTVAKKSYDFSFRTEGLLPTVGKFPGLPWTKDLIFISNFYDPSMLRNVLAYSTWESLGHPSPAFTFCHVYLNEVYEGIYLVTEKIRSLDQLIDKSQWKPSISCLSQPFFMRIDWENDGEVPIQGMREYPIYADQLDPKLGTKRGYNSSYKTYFEALNSAFAKILLENSEGPSYKEFIDTTSFVDYFLLNELSKNPDAYRSSVYFYTSESGKLTMGPVWDFDLAFANTLNPEDDNIEGWMYLKKLPESAMKTMPNWWYVLMCDADFRQNCVSRLHVFEEYFNSEAFASMMYDYCRGLEAKMVWEMKRWGRPYEFTTIPGPLQKTTEEEFSEMKLFLQKRIAWMKQNLENQECVSPFTVMAEYDDYETIEPDTLKQQFKIQFNYDLSPSMRMPGSRYNYYSDYSFVLLDDRGNHVGEGPVTGKSLDLTYLGWKKGTYYLIVAERSRNSLLATSAPIMTHEFRYKLIVPVE